MDDLKEILRPMSLMGKGDVGARPILFWKGDTAELLLDAVQPKKARDQIATEEAHDDDQDAPASDKGERQMVV
jgi:hypothetical protein